MSDLPERWVMTTIGEIADLVNGRAFRPSEWSGEGLPIIRIQNLKRSDLPFNCFNGSVDERHLVSAGDLLFAWSGTPGTSFGAHVWHGPDAVLNQHIFNIRVDPALIDRGFLATAINGTLDAQIAKAHGGAGLRHVTRSAFEATPIALPPLAEQKRIMDRLRSYEQRVVAIGRSLNEAVSGVELGRARILAAAYDLDLLPPSRIAGARALGFVQVGDVAADLSYGSSAKSASSGEVAVLRMGNVKDGELDWSDLVYTSNRTEINKYRLERGDVLFNRTNGSPHLVGKSAVYWSEHPAIHAGYLIRIRCAERMLPEYLGYCLNSPQGRAYWLAVRSDSSGLSNVSARKLAAFRLRCPPLEDQRLICEAVLSGLQHLRTFDAAVARAREALRTTTAELMKAALSGRLGTGGGADETAAVQLKMLKEAKRSGPIRSLSPTKPKRTKVTEMQTTVLEVLKRVVTPLPAQEVARLCGVGADAGLDEIERFYAELRSLEHAKLLEVETVRDAGGAKVGDLLGLQPVA